MKAIITLLLIGISFGVNAQSAKSKKLHKYYAKGDLKKSESLANKILKKDKKNNDALYILTLVQLNEAKDLKSNAAKKKNLLRSIETMNRIQDQSSSYYLQLNDSIHSYLLLLLSENNLSKNYKSAYLQLLAETFKDTLSEYRQLSFSSLQRDQQTVDFGDLDSLRAAMLLFAGSLKGTPYKWAGENPKTGFDCSGFTKYVYHSIGVELPHNAQLQSELIMHRKSLDEALPGDLIFFGSQHDKKFRTQHAGIVYSKNGSDIEVIHCVSNGVNIDGKNSSWDQYWKDKVLFVVDLFSIEEWMEGSE
jgi:cell wall-associated NlpC family hydrolase